MGEWSANPGLIWSANFPFYKKKEEVSTITINKDKKSEKEKLSGITFNNCRAVGVGSRRKFFDPSKMSSAIKTN
jgi:hypothetical protein